MFGISAATEHTIATDDGATHGIGSIQQEVLLDIAATPSLGGDATHAVEEIDTVRSPIGDIAAFAPSAVREKNVAAAVMHNPPSLPAPLRSPPCFPAPPIALAAGSGTAYPNLEDASHAEHAGMVATLWSRAGTTPAVAQRALAAVQAQPAPAADIAESALNYSTVDLGVSGAADDGATESIASTQQKYFSQDARMASPGGVATGPVEEISSDISAVKDLVALAPQASASAGTTNVCLTDNISGEGLVAPVPNEPAPTNLIPGESFGACLQCQRFGSGW